MDSASPVLSNPSPATGSAGRSLHFEQSNDRKMSSLYLSIMDRVGVCLPQFGESNEQLTGI
jgi:hypothetical protein